MRNASHAHSVLVVEDHQALCDGLVYALSGHGYDARGAHSGLDALALLAAGYRPCVLLLDLKMPDVSGWEVARMLLDNPKTASIPIVVLSGDVRAASAPERPVASILTKPVEPDALLATVAAHARCPVGHAANA